LPVISRSKKAVLKHVATLARYAYFENYSAAEKLLNEVKNEIKRKGIWGEGCYSAVKGMIMAGREKNKIALFWKAKNSQVKNLDKIKSLLIKDLTRENIDKFEEGFLEAWITIIDTFMKIKKQFKR